MAASEAEVCNLALLLVGQTQFIDDLNDPTEAGEVCKQVYAKARDAALEAYAWPFATRRQALSLVADLTIGGGGFAYVYTLNGDVLAARWLDVGIENPSEAEKVPFKIEDHSQYGRVLLTNQADAILVYTRKVTESGKFSPLFVEALAAKVAVYLAAGLVKKPRLALEMMALFRSVLATAAAAQFNQQQKDTEPDSDYVTERG